MRAARALAVLAALLIALAAMAAWLLPPRLGAAQLRPLIERLASARLGAAVHIGGDVALALLPRPILRADHVTVAGRAGLRADIDDLRVDLQPGPLLAGRIAATTLRLRGLRLLLPWPLDPAALLARAPTAGGADWTLGGAVVIEDAALLAGPHRLDGIAGSLTLDRLTGAAQVEATASLAGTPLRLSARVGAAGGDGAYGVELSLGAAQLGAAISGQVAPDGGFAGRISATGDDVSAWLPGPPAALRAEGRLTLGGGLAAADDLTLELGGQAARGALALRWSPQPRLDVALAAGRLDLDRWLAARGPALPFPVGLDISADAATLRGGTLRDLRFDVDLLTSGFTLHELQATLPGEARLSLQGGPPGPALTATAHLSAPDIPATYAWLAGAGWVPRLPDPAGLPRAAEGDGAVHLAAGRAELVLSHGSADGHALTGAVALRLDGAAPFVEQATLDADTLGLDGLGVAWPDWLGGLSLQAKQALFRGQTLAPLSVVGRRDGGALVVTRFDTWIGAMHLAGGGTASGLDTPDPRIDALALDATAPDAASVRPMLPASWPDLPRGSPMAREKLALHLDGAGPAAALATRLAAEWGDLRLDGTPVLDLPGHALRGPLRLHHPGARRLLEESGLLRAAGLEGDSAWLGEGSLALSGDASVQPDALALGNATITAGGLSAAADLQLLLGGGAPLLSGRVTARTLPLPGAAALGGDVLPWDLLAGWKAALRVEAASVVVDQKPRASDAAADISLGDGTLRLEHGAATAFGGAASGALSLDALARPPVLRLDATLQDAAITAPLLDWPVDVVAGRLGVQANAEASGHSLAALRATLQGRLTATLRDGVASGLDLAVLAALPSDPAIRAALSGGRSAGIAGTVTLVRDGPGAAHASGSLASADAAVAVSGSLDLANRLVDLRLLLTPRRPDAPAIGLRLGGPLDAPVGAAELADLVRWRAAASH